MADIQHSVPSISATKVDSAGLSCLVSANQCSLTTVEMYRFRFFLPMFSTNQLLQATSPRTFS